MAKINPVPNPYCFSERLQARLANIPQASLTVVEAPSGFGKTTAVREYFAATLKGSAREKWYTCLGESPAKAWVGICGLFSGVDDAVARALAELGVPTRETLPDVAALLRQCRCKKASYLVIDNYQLFDNGVQRKLLAAFSACRDNNLRLIVVTQPLKAGPETTHQENPYHTITQKDFFFDEACIAKYCRLSGIAIAPEDIGRIQAVAEGWIAAIRLQLKYYQESGAFMDSAAIGALVETAVWNKLSAEEKDFMLAIALPDGVTARQAAILGDGAAVPKSIRDLLSMEFFIRYVADKKIYSLHSILRDYLLERFAMQPHEFIDAMHRKAASACLAEADYFQAARFFLKVSDYDAILSMPFTDQYFFNNQEGDIIQFFERVFQECPPETLLRHPLTLTAIGVQFYKKGMRELYSRLVALLEEFLTAPPEMPEKELYRIKGEFEMMLFFSRFNDVAGMGEHHKKAYGYLKHVSNPPRSRIYVGNLPWAVGVPSVISVYWNKSGGLQNALEAMDECLPFYAQLAGGHGTGGEFLMRAEACLARGDDTGAEILCYKTLYAAGNAGQTSNRLCAELVLARIGILRGDGAAYSTARRNITSEMGEARQTALTRLGELCLAHLDMGLGNTDTLPEWLRDIQAIKRTFYAITQPHVIMMHSWMLLLGKRFPELYALTESAQDAARAMHYPLLQVYHLIFLTLAGLEHGRGKEAVGHLRQALAIALPDRVYLPFAEHGEALLPLLERLKGEFDGARMAECLALCRRWSAGRTALLRELSDAPPPFGLSARQYETARLAAQGLSNQEIAETLFVSVNTVKTHLQTAYRKTGTSSRPVLKKLLR